MRCNKAAIELGRLAKGIPKTLTVEERMRRSNWMKLLNKKRRDHAHKNSKAKVD